MTTKSQKKRLVIIHKHLFKNAGSTFDWSLRKNFGDGFCDHRDDVPMLKQGESYLLKFLYEHPEIRALSSHHLWFHFSYHPTIELIPVYILRHPIERIRSVYNFERIQQSDSLGAVAAKKMSFKEYAEWRMNYDVPDTIRNFQTRYCSGIRTGKSITLQHYESAKKELEECNFVGTVDQYDESMEVFKAGFNDIGISIDLSYTAQNVNQSIHNVDYNTRAKLVLDELGGLLAEDVLEKNKYDIKLYHYAKNKLNKAYQSLIKIK